MIRICDSATPQLAGRHRARLKFLWAVLAAVLLLNSSFVRAATIDWNVAGTANYDSALDPDGGLTPNWIDTTQSNTTTIPVSVPSNAPVGIPGNNDDAAVRNGGTVEITSATTQRSLNVGVNRTLYTDDGTTISTSEQGGDGTVNMLGGSIIGPVDLVGPDFRYGTQIRLGGTGLGAQNYTGIFNQSAGKITLNVGSASGATSSNIIIGNGVSSSTPTSVFTLSGTGQIGMVYDAGGHRGINVRTGTFNMTGGSIFNEEAVDVNLYNQQFMQIASTSGTANGPVGSAGHTVATANFSGGTVDVHHGLRVAPNNRAEGYVTISGTASLKLGNDLQLAANAGTVTPLVDAAYGQLDMSGGYLQVGQATPLAANTNYDKKFILGDAGRGVFTQTGGTVVVGDQLRMSNNAVSSALFTMKDPVGGPTGVPFSFTAKNVETRNSATIDTTLNSDVIIDSPDATFKQTNYIHPTLGTVLTGSTKIGTNGKSTFEIRQGNVLFGQVTAGGTNAGNLELSGSANARATLNLKGGKLTVGGNVTRSDVSAGSIPSVNLIGGQLVLDPQIAVPTSVNWLTAFNNTGSEITTRPNQLLQVLVGDPTHVGNFSMSSGIWDIDISGHTVTSADRFVVNSTGGTGSLTGGTLALNYISGYTPTNGDSLRIVQAVNGGVTLNAPGVSILAPGSDPNWSVQTVGTDIRLVYTTVPEPASFGLVVIGLLMGIGGFRRRS
jgi:hypothetical protein